MIGYLTGKALFVDEESIILDVRGVGYRIACTPKTQALVLAQENTSLFIHTIVRENAFDLYGFESQHELFFFRKLLSVSGIGPRSALAMLSLASPDTLYQAITQDNIAFLTSVPGIGKKTAERMCVELRDKLKDYQGDTRIAVHEGDQDVIDALVALGYSQAQAHQALSQIPQEVQNTQERIKRALQTLASS